MRALEHRACRGTQVIGETLWRQVLGHGTDFGANWSEVVANWYLGVTPSLSAKHGLEALGTLERLWPDRLDEVLAGSARGVGVMAPLIDLGLTLAACEELGGFDRVLARMKAGDRGAYSEAKLAATLVEAGYQPVLEPPLGEGHLDALVVAKGKKVWIEVISPDMSDATRQAYEEMKLLADALTEQHPGMAIDVYLAADPCRDVSDAVRSLVETSARSGTRAVHELSGIAFVQCGAFGQGAPARRPEPMRVAGPVLFVSSMAKRDDIQTRTSVEYAMSDQRAQKLMTDESHHFCPNEANILAMDVSKVPDGMRVWASLIERRFQPTINRRFGAVVLFCALLEPRLAVIRCYFTALRNPHAHNKPPDPLLTRLENLGGPPPWTQA